MEERSAKRRKANERGEDDYLPGNIIEIEIHNFMTYNHLKCKPGSRLNLVIGPNGSGKSSLVCAIALGLVGEPQLLGRASSIGAYVKRGEENGYIKIYLRGYSPSEQISITRKIDIHNRSEWMINGKVLPKRDVLEVIQRFNIQVGNLTQFLPQDRVCEFAKLTPIQLLEETEKAVGNPELPVQHRALIDKSRDLKRLELTVKQMGDTLNQLKALNAEQEKDVKRVRQREQLLAKVESMKKKLPWLKYDVKKLKYKEAKELEKDAKKKLDESAKLLNVLTKPVEEQKQLKAKQDSSCKKVQKIVDENAKKRAQILEKENYLGVQVRAKLNEVEELNKREESRQERIAKAKEDLAAAELELSNLSTFKPPREEIERLGDQIVELEVAAKEQRTHRKDLENHLSQKKGTLRQCMDRLKEMENANVKLLQALQRTGADKIFEAYEWLQSHRHELKKDVFGPVLLEVNVPNRGHAAYLEGHVAHYIWKSFITLDPADRDLLVNNLKAFEIPVLNYVGNINSAKVPFQVSDEMRDLGITSRLDQVFEAPEAVKEVLISQSKLDHSFIGSAEADKRADEVARLGILDLWTPENHYRWSKSRYGNHVSASVEVVHPSRLFCSSLDSKEVDNLKSRKRDLEQTILGLEENLKTLLSEQRQLEDEEAKLHKQREEIVNIAKLERKKRQDMENRIDQRRRKLKSMEEEDDLEISTRRLIDQAANLNAQRVKKAIELKNLLIEAIALKWSYAEKHFSAIELDMKIRELEAGLKEQEKAALQASQQYECSKENAEKCRHELQAAKEHADSVARITPELAGAFLEMPTTVEELEASIQDSISEANSILFLNHNVLEEYENRQFQINQISEKHEADSKELDNCLSEIESLKEKWLPTLKDLVARIGATFSRNFQEMAVAGEVTLDEQGTDFDKYGILIKVKFRQTGQLQVLSAHHQSGGERSVSTILYLVSLQDITNCPFRVVDEINQGNTHAQRERERERERETESTWSCGDCWGTVMGLRSEEEAM
ncbi:structural maintenance of chromosomes protein 5 [Amborella trichopoda]|uniref:structural maintenance of chromosomes protein 5 n=1 Tax=Amborella trichopoda TaxID=13333 RepID=UPI0009BDCAAF|nr:structural maintenance of chromosomes protein 5 [Amborella trichopoda]|eukprot:XP_020526897.1 structural maintenance of chromosomes protein 5 [Amborella trichopoda]